MPGCHIPPAISIFSNSFEWNDITIWQNQPSFQDLCPFQPFSSFNRALHQLCHEQFPLLFLFSSPSTTFNRYNFVFFSWLSMVLYCLQNWMRTLQSIAGPLFYVANLQTSSHCLAWRHCSSFTSFMAIPTSFICPDTSHSRKYESSPISLDILPFLQ